MRKCSIVEKFGHIHGADKHKILKENSNSWREKGEKVVASKP